MIAMMLRRYTFKLYPTMAQAEALDAQRRMAAELWNALLAQREQQMAHERIRKPMGERRYLTYLGNQSAEIKHLRAACPEWQVPACTMLHKVAENLDDAVKAYWRRRREGRRHFEAGWPRFKAIARAEGIPFRNMRNGGWKLTPAGGKNWRLFVKGVPNLLKLRGCFPVDPLRIRNMDLIWRDGAWWMSVCVDVPSRRDTGDAAVEVRFDLVDEFAAVWRDRQRVASAPVAFDTIRALAERRDELAREADTRFRKGSYRHRRAKRRIAAIQAKEKRVRADALHVWTAGIVRDAATLSVVAPPVREVTESPRGDERRHGAAVETVSKLNRNTLSQAPALAVAMLAYKAAEAGAEFVLFQDEKPVTAVGRDLVATTKAARRARRKVREAA